jgi:tRNA1(Val) A37 N6-methylase TrmN6
VTLDLSAHPDVFAAAGLELDSFDRVLMNPPFNDASRQNVSPDADRRMAHVAPHDLLVRWVDAASRLLHSAGTLTLIWRADGLTDVLEALESAFGGVAVVPVHGRAGQPAIRVIVRASKGVRAPLSLMPALVLNDAAGKPTAAAEEILRDAQPLKFGG